jgi:hypothetical protein
MSKKYHLRFFFDWCSGGCLWAGNDAAREKYGEGSIDKYLPLSIETKELSRSLSAWHDESLNWRAPLDPGPWRQEECDKFNLASKELLQVIRDELGEEFNVINEQSPMVEDPDLDRYLADPKNFLRDKAEE